MLARAFQVLIQTDRNRVQLRGDPHEALRQRIVDLSRQARIERDLVALVSDGQINLRCGPVGVPNHAPIPLLALYLHTSPARIVSAT